MSSLTEDEKRKTSQYPLGSSLDAVRNTSRSGQDDLAALLKLVEVLDVCLSIGSRTGRRSLAADLTEIRTEHSINPLDEKLYSNLLRVVREREPDINVWNAITALALEFGSRPPQTIEQERDQTPLRDTSASQQDPSRNRSEVETQLGRETEAHTFRSVGHFYSKYFQGKSWEGEARGIWDGAKNSHVSGQWEGIPEKPTENQMHVWWSNFQRQYLDGNNAVRGTYNTEKITDSFGDNKTEQLDLYCASRLSKGHNWTSIDVIGELKKSAYNTSGAFHQMCRYVRDVFHHQPTRLFVHAFTIIGNEMETWVVDRSGPFAGEVFDINKNPDKFIQVICGYAMMSDKELGHNPFIKERGKELIISANEPSSKMVDLVLDSFPIASQPAIVCRGTCCYRAKVKGDPNSSSIVKFSWSPIARTQESALLKLARRRHVKGVGQLIASRQITTTNELRKGLDFDAAKKKRTSGNGSGQGSKKRKSNRQQAQAALGANVVGHSPRYDARALRVMAIFPAGKRVMEFENLTELIGGLRDAIKGHKSLYQDGKILHRDITDGNIILTDPAISGFSGMLIDLDVAQDINKGSSGSRTRTAAVQFMAINVLLGAKHTFRHDLESFLYVLIWVCIRKGWEITKAPNNYRQKSMLKGWYSESYLHMAERKRGNMVKDGIEALFREFPSDFDCVKPLCRRVRDILFKETVDTSTPSNSDALYDPIIMAFDDELKRLRKLNLRTVPMEGSDVAQMPPWGMLRPQGQYDQYNREREWDREMI